jgi:hypothetical protein
MQCLKTAQGIQELLFRNHCRKLTVPGFGVFNLLIMIQNCTTAAFVAVSMPIQKVSLWTPQSVLVLSKHRIIRSSCRMLKIEMWGVDGRCLFVVLAYVKWRFRPFTLTRCSCCEWIYAVEPTCSAVFLILTSLPSPSPLLPVLETCRRKTFL